MRGQRERARIESEEATGFVQILGRKEALQGARTLGEILRESAGVQIRSLGSWGALTQASIRGSTPGQVQVFLDGVLLNHGSMGGVDLGDLPLGGLERIEVYRGFVPASLGGAMGGAIHLVTREGGRLLRWGMGATLGSFASAKVQAHYQHGVGAWRWGLFANYLHSGGAFSYYDDRGTPLHTGDDQSEALRQNNDTHLAQVIGRMGGRWGKVNLDISHLLAWREQGIPGLGQFRSLEARYGSLRNAGQLRVQAQQIPWSQTRMEGQIQWLQQSEVFRDPLGEIGVGRRIIESGRDSLGGTALLEWWITPHHRVQWPLWMRWEQATAVDQMAGGRALAGGQRVHGWSALAYQGQMAGEWVTWQAAMRLEGAYTSPSVQTVGAEEVLRWYPTGRVGVQIWPWRPLRIKANVGRYLRLPDFSEMFGDRGATMGNPALRPEQGWQWDIGLQWRMHAPSAVLRRLEIEAVFFGSAAQDLIRWLQNSQRTLVAANIDQALTMGMEARLLLEISSWLRVEGAFTLLDARNLSIAAFEQGRQLPGRPRYDAFVQATLQRSWGRLFYRYHFLGENWLDRANLHALGSRHLHGLGAVLYPARLARKWGIDVPWEGLRVHLDISNLLDQRMTWVDLQPPLPNRTQTPQAIADIGGYPLPGRAFFLSVHWEFF
ncbi:TonB-dependent receptor [Myxococcota bacterium]|nr:TonB-dependent receptor [Myxococcota bacterium]